MSRRSGFTLVEIMIVVAIIGLLAAIAIPSFMKARQQSQQKACINNLRQIDAAKEQAALEMRWTNGSAVANGQSNVNVYIKGLTGTNTPTCPAAGVYTYNAIGTNPTCDVADHVLPAP
jgi:prepilin-type N-terminal cleavage/methylation domain-containing protein